MSSEPQKHSSKNADPEMESWSAVEDELKTHDQQMVKDYAEDVDNLLVFAGLFSAVLTAFLVESYQMLQEDNEETNKFLLRRISTQLESFSLSPSFANATLLGSLPPDDFTPTRAALWINALWFLSLIFSLAAAFFGIRVRQWLREYMQWSAPLKHPRENVHLRQIRYTDFETWRVFGSIAIIPGLLELALVFFVSGIVIFLWTIDPTIAIVITVAVSIFLAVASTITMLPALLKRCPYKSPTAWAFVLLCSPIPDSIAFARGLWAEYKTFRTHPLRLPVGLPENRWGYLRGAWRETVYGHEGARTWRDRDFEGGHVRATRSSRYSLAEDLANMTGDRTDNVEIYIKQEGYKAGFYIASEVGWLARALVWVMQSSQSSNTRNHAIHCTQSIHTPLRTDTGSAIQHSIQSLANLYAVEHVSLWLIHPIPRSTNLSSSPKGVTAFRSELRLKLLQECDVTEFPQSTPQMILIHCPPFTRFSSSDEVYTVITTIWACHLRQLLPLVLEDPCHCPLALDAILILSLWRHHTRGCREWIIQCFNFCQDNAPTISKAFNKHGIRASIFQLLSLGWDKDDGIMFDDIGHLIEDPSRPDERFNSPKSVINFARSRGDTILDVDDMRIFTTLTEYWMIDRFDSTTIEDRVTIIEEMTRFTDAARKRGFLNCGHIEDLPWFFWEIYYPERLLPFCEGATLDPFRRLLKSLQSSHELDLLTGRTANALTFLQRVALTVPQDAREDKDRFADWIKTVPRWGRLGRMEILGEEMEAFGGAEVEHVFPLVTTATGDLDLHKSLASIPEVVGVYELEAQ